MVKRRDSKSRRSGDRRVGSTPTSSARAGSVKSLPAFLYWLHRTIFGPANEHTIHCICRSLLCVVIQVCVDVCCCGIGTMSQPYLDLLHCDIFSAVKQKTCTGMPLRYNYDKPEKPRRIKGFEVFSLIFSSFSKPKNHTEISRIAGGVSLTTNE